MSAFYLDILKDRLYTYTSNSIQRRSAQTVLYEILNSLTKIIAPILSFTAEEIWQLKFQGEAESVHLSLLPRAENKFIDKRLEEKWDKIIAVRDEVLKKIEEKRIAGDIRSSLEAKVIIKTADEKKYELLESCLEELPFIFIVSQVELKSNQEDIVVMRADGEKCPRCWNYFVKLQDSQNVCPRCTKALGGGT
jgi:isoleucyl-tRNA synthetase